jgi:uncharacterized protein (DUF1330 family)
MPPTGGKTYTEEARRAVASRSLREGRDTMVTCYLRYVIDPEKMREFESYARMWIPIVKRMGGTHHGYFLPHEGANNVAIALFSFPSLAAYEEYRTKMQSDPESQQALQAAEHSRCIISYERSFMRPLLF